MNFLGKVRQIDVFVAQPDCQLIFNSATGTELVARTADARCLSILETSMALSKQVAIEYTSGNPNVITRVTLSA